MSEGSPKQVVTVVVVDDDDFFRAKIESWLRANSRFQCVGCFADGESGLAEIRARKPALAIIDFGLPGIKGDEVIWRAKQAVPSVKIVAVSGIPDNAIVFEALDAGADGFLDKPLDRTAFFAELEEILRGGFPLSERARKLVVHQYQQSRPKPWLMALLSDREKEVAELTCRGLGDDAIARALGLAVFTVRTHQRNIHEKLHVHGRAELQIKLFGLERPRAI